MDYNQALSRAAALCSSQERCASEIRQKLNKWEVPQEVSDKIISRLKEEQFINENRFASFYTRDKFRFNGWGRIKITWQLKQKDVNAGSIEKALEEINEDDYQEKLNTILTNKLKQIKNKDPWQTRAALIRHAQSRGFEPDLIYAAIDKLITN